jgi:hypothetical protein
MGKVAAVSALKGLTAVKALTAVSTAASVLQGFQRASGAEEQATYNAAIQRQQAQQILNNQRISEEQKRKVNRARISSQLAQIGKSGVELSGSASGLVSRSIAEQELEILNDRYNAEVQAYNVGSGAALTEFEGDTLASEARAGAAEDLFSGGKKLVKLRKAGE